MSSLIYKIYCKDKNITEVYVGSTDDFHTRCKSHTSRCHNENDAKYNYKVYKFIRANGGMKNFIFEPIIECEEDTRYEAEVHYFKTLNSKLNTVYPRRTKKEYYLDNKEQIIKQHKKYIEENIEQIHRQKNVKNECQCGGRYTNSNKSSHLRTKFHKLYLEQIE